MTINPVGWFEIYVDDMARAKKFYEAVFQVKLERLNAPTPEMWAFPMNPERMGTSGALVHMKGFSAGRNSVLVYFSCEDCATEQARAIAAGGKLQNQKMSIGQYGYISLVYDTEGNMIGLHSMK
ncbi:MAG TPA: lactoylglutathione lyase [Moraxellaceae bacterium]|nr:lactoylglutathione lyase [Moraxellaceae bacterium]